jgi:hypothetical protein
MSRPLGRHKLLTPLESARYLQRGILRFVRVNRAIRIWTLSLLAHPRRIVGKGRGQRERLFLRMNRHPDCL